MQSNLRLETIPVCKYSDWLVTEEEGVSVLDSDLMVLPWTVNTVILKHVCLHTKHKNKHESDLQNHVKPKSDRKNTAKIQ